MFDIDRFIADCCDAVDKDPTHKSAAEVVRRAMSDPSKVLEALGVLMFFAMNLHHVVFFTIGQTFIARPVGTGWLLPSWDSLVVANPR